MGVVYRAYDPQLDRPVAVKLIEAEPDDDRSIERRLAEAHALASLSHPNVVRIFDVGTYDAAEAESDPAVAALLPGGGIFLVLELVEGPTLGQWARERATGWRAIRDAFVAAGRGLEAAHAAGLVHHDFKPDNAVVGNDGRVRVLDFGLARQAETTLVAGGPQPGIDDAERMGSAERSNADATAVELRSVTRAGAHTRAAGTPVYMAPEQHDGGPTGPASDQFAFCVALYEALCRRVPFAGDDIASLARNKRRGEIDMASSVTGAPWWLMRALHRGLSADAGARWPSMGALLGALRRDRIRGQRRRWSLAMGATAVLAATSTAWAVRAPHAEDACTDPQSALDGAWDDDRRRRIRDAFEEVPRPYTAATLASVERELDGYGARWRAGFSALCEPPVGDRPTTASLGGDPRLLELARYCMMQRRTELQALVESLAEADTATVEHAVTIVGRLRPVDSCTNPATLRMAEQLPGDPVRREAVEQAYAELIRVGALRIAGHEAAAVALAESVRDQAQALDYPPLEAEVLRHLAQARIDAGDQRRGLQLLRDAIAAGIRTNNHRSAARSWMELLFETTRTGEGPAVAFELESVVDQAVERTGDDALALPWLNNLGGAYLTSGDVDNGERVLRQAEALLDTQPDPRGHLRVLGNLATIPLRRLQWSEAEERLLEVLALQEQLYGPGHPDLALTLQNLGWSALQRGEATAAIDYAERLVAVLDPIWGDHPSVARGLALVAEGLYMQGDVAGARAKAEMSLAMLERLGGQRDAARPALHLLADLEQSSGRYEAARRYRLEIQALEERARGPEHPDNWVSRAHLSTLDALTGRTAVARARLAKVSAWFSDGQHEVHDDYRCWIASQIGLTHAALGDVDTALVRLRDGVACAQQASLPASFVAQMRFDLAGVLVARDPVEAVAMARDALREVPVAARPQIEAWVAAQEGS